VGNLNKRKNAFMQQFFKLDEEWKASMEAKVDAIVVGMTKVDSMVESMAEIKVMLHKRHGHSKVDTCINLSTTTNEGTLVAMVRNGIFFKEMAITLVLSIATLAPTPPSLKVNHTKPTTLILEGIGKEQTLVAKNHKHMDEGVEEGGPIKK
jgi:hypothetical protein